MRWIVLNAVGALSWLAGLMCAKGSALQIAGLAPDSHRLLVGFVLGSLGLFTLVWANVRSSA